MTDTSDESSQMLISAPIAGCYMSGIGNTSGNAVSVDVVVIDMPLLDTRHEKNLLGTFISDIVLQLLSYVSETERTNIKQRQAEGIAAAKKRGVKFGRPIKEMPPNFAELIEKWNKKELTMSEICKVYDMSESTFYRRLREYEVAKVRRK